jgi:hypothetical protein
MDNEERTRSPVSPRDHFAADYTGNQLLKSGYKNKSSRHRQY